MSATKLIGAEEAAKGLGLNKWKLYQLAKKKAIPHTRLGKRLYFREEALVRWLEEQESENSQPGGGSE